MIFDVDVAVVGAGPAGLLLAGDLARAGGSCAVFETPRLAPHSQPVAGPRQH